MSQVFRSGPIKTRPRKFAANPQAFFHKVFLTALLLSFGQVAPPLTDVAHASTLRLSGGMGLTTWPMSIATEQGTHDGVGLGITGRFNLRLFDHLRLQAGLLQGEWQEDDLSQLKRSLIFFGAEARLPLWADLYATAGARVGGAHLVVTETLQTQANGQRSVADLNRWSPVVEPMLSLGWLLADKFHFEIDGGASLDFAGGQVGVSPIILVGVYFKMFDSSGKF